MKKAKSLNFLILHLLILTNLGFMFTGYGPEFLVAFVILIYGFVQAFVFSYGQIGHRKFLFSLPFTCLCVVGVLIVGIWNFLFNESINEVRYSALISFTSIFVLIGVLLEAFDQEN